MTDPPAVDFVPELLELYPDAKAVLVTRDRDRWWESFGKALELNMACLLVWAGLFTTGGLSIYAARCLIKR